MSSSKGRTAKLAILLAVVATFAQAQATVSGFGGFGDGTAASPSGFFAGDPTKGIFSQGVNSIGVSLAGVEVFRFSSSGISIISDTIGVRFGAAADLSLLRGGSGGTLRVLGGTTPTGTGCGTGAAFAGNNTNGSVVIGTTPGTCAITFNGTLTSAPNVYLNEPILTTGTTTCRATSITTTGFTITCTAGLVSTDKVSWFAVVP
jgi:hypothetical protein